MCNSAPMEVGMKNQIQVAVDQKVYARLIELKVAPCKDINDVIDHLLFHDGHRSIAATGLEAEENHFTLEEEIERTRAGVYDTAGC